MVDAALLRPGRMDHIIYVPPPDFEVSILSQQYQLVGSLVWHYVINHNNMDKLHLSI